jgi:hypothetical protein
MENQKKKKPKWKKIVLFMATLLVLMAVASGAYVMDYYHSTSTYEEYVAASDLTITQEDSLVTVTGDNANGIGIIFYPGAKVEYIAYLPLMEALAKEGYTCFLQEMPGNLAMFGINKADDIIAENTEIRSWYISGHSLGGAMASSYAAENNAKLAGIIFMGAYPAYDISQTSLKQLSIIGSEDLVLNGENYEAAKPFAPEGSVYQIIEGGNHGYFGDYGEQAGDGTATITREEQIALTAGYIKEFIGE